MLLTEQQPRDHAAIALTGRQDVLYSFAEYMKRLLLRAVPQTSAQSTDDPRTAQALVAILETNPALIIAAYVSKTLDISVESVNLKSSKRETID